MCQNLYNQFPFYKILIIFISSSFRFLILLPIIGALKAIFMEFLTYSFLGILLVLKYASFKFSFEPLTF
jgi:hypothetical protein